MITQLTTMEWARLRELAKTQTVDEWRKNSLGYLWSVAKKREQGASSKWVSWDIARECEKWCKQ
jgi:hypothetical protein